jgi:sigma-B regulation protein RsbU (phosphoserine phosphatase)
MKIRWKLLIVLLSISLIPMILMRWYNQGGMRSMGEELAARTHDVLVEKANLELKILVDEHANILQRDRALIDLVLKVQVSELEKRLFVKNGQQKSLDVHQASENKAEQNVFRNSGKHYKAMDGRNTPLAVSYDGLGNLSDLESVATNPETFDKLLSMVPVYRSLIDAHPYHILWQLTLFEDGTQVIYPAIQKYHIKFNGYQEEWYQHLKKIKKMFWSRPVIEPFTHQLSFIVSYPLIKPDGKFIGATAIVVPVGSILHVDEHIRSLSENITVLLVRTDNDPKSHTPGIRIVAREHELGKKHGHWQVAESEEWLIDDGKSVGHIIEGLSGDLTGVTEISYKGNKSLVAYRSIDKLGLALMFIVNKKDIVAESENMRQYVLDRVIKQINVTEIILVAAFLVVICTAFFLSRSVTTNIQKLVNAVRLITSGEFKTRTHIKSHDEIGELSRALDKMIPELEERMDMKQALDVAMQVQKSLLPQKMPKTKGLDIAAKSVYCDETGGDFYDFLDFCCREPGVIGIAVGDVSGHGVPAALLMASVRAFLRSRVTQPGNIEQVVNDVNRLLTKDVGESGQFVTLYYMEINHSKKEIIWIRAGHDPALLYDPTIDEFEELQGRGILMGVDSQYDFQPNIRSGLNPGQVLIIGTDGIWETRNSSGKMFGKQRLMDLIHKNAHSSSEDIVKTVLHELEKFRGNSRQEDDVTLVVVKVE